MALTSATRSVVDATLARPDVQDAMRVPMRERVRVGEQLCRWLRAHLHDEATSSSTPDLMKLTRLLIAYEQDLSDLQADLATAFSGDPRPALNGGTPPAGWYADPWAEHTMRYWDGGQWTGHGHDP